MTSGNANKNSWPAVTKPRCREHGSRYWKDGRCRWGWSFSEGFGWAMIEDDACSETEPWEPKAKDPAKQKRGKNDRKGGIQAQLDANKLANFHHRTGHGVDGVYYAPDGTTLLKAESKRKKSMPPSEIEGALQQAESYPEPGNPKAVLLWTTVPGQGRKGATYMILRAEDWPDIAERLSYRIGDDA